MDTDPHVTGDERTWGMIAHLSAFIGLAVPFGNAIAPLVVLLAKRETSAFVARHAKEALNFNITILIAAIVAGILVLVLVGVLLLGAIAVYWLVMTIVAAVRASEGADYRYPATLRLVQ